MLLLSSALHAEDKVVPFINSLKISKSTALNNNRQTSLIRDTNTDLHLVYFVDAGNQSQVFYINSKNNGEAWTQPILVSGKLNNAQNPSLILFQNKPYVFFTENGQIYLSIGDTSGFGEPVKLSGNYRAARDPVATTDKNENIHLLFENSGQILYRFYENKKSSWSDIFILSTAGKSASNPNVAVDARNILLASWIEDGNVLYRTQNINSSLWSNPKVLTNYPAIGSATLGAKNLIAIMDSESNYHFVWNAKNQVLHKMFYRGVLQDTVSLSENSMPWLGAPTLAGDESANVWAVWIEEAHMVLRKFENRVWKTKQNLGKLSEASLDFSPKLGRTPKGVDLVWINQPTRFTDGNYQINFFSTTLKESAPEKTTPEIYSVDIREGRPNVKWKANSDQKGFRIIMDIKDPPATPYAYDSGSIDGTFSSYQIKNFNYKPAVYYVQVRSFDSQGRWSAWSKPFVTNASSDQKAPVIQITRIEENSMFMYSPDTHHLYYGAGIDQPKPIIIHGKTFDIDSGLEEISFSPLLGDAPPPLIKPRTRTWTAQYTLKSSDDPGEITVTAKDHFGNITREVIQVIKDITPPGPPQFVKVFADQNNSDINAASKKDDDGEIYLSYSPAADDESGIRYHLAGTDPIWYKNNIHAPGDALKAFEGGNTVYVYAVDNVGNVSLPGTDTIFVDTKAPRQIKITSFITSKNYVMGSMDSDVVEIKADDETRGITLLEKGNFKFEHDLQNGEKKQFSFVARDSLGHLSPPTPILIGYDTTPPKIGLIVHTGSDTVRAYDKLTVTLTGDLNNTATFRIGELTSEIPMYDDGSHGDVMAGDGQYTGQYLFDNEDVSGKFRLYGSLSDLAGNRVTELSLVPIILNPLESVLVDDFENMGYVYPLENHCQAVNVDSFSETQIPPQSGTGTLRLDYNFQNEQNWSLALSPETPPRNFYGPRPVLSFWLKGSGSQTLKGYIKLRGKSDKTWSGYLSNPFAQTLPFSVVNSTWHQVQIPLTEEQARYLKDVIQYSIILKSDNKLEKGTLFFDQVRITYSPRTKTYDEKKYPVQQKQLKPDTFTNQTLFSPNLEFAPAPYLAPELFPTVPVLGETLVVKVKIPKELSPKRAAVLLGKYNGQAIGTALVPANFDYWKGTFALPIGSGAGVHEGSVFLETSDGRFYKTPFYYESVLKNDKNPTKQIVTSFFPHPLVVGSAAEVKIKIPNSLTPKNVFVFLSDTEQSVSGGQLRLIKNTAEFQYWGGPVDAPSDFKTGTYQATLIIKTMDGQIIRKLVPYQVIDESR